MAIKTWGVKFAGRQLQVKLAKAEAEHLANRLHRLQDVRQWTREITGVRGGEESACLLWTLGGSTGHALASEEQYQADLAAFLATIPELIDKSTAGDILAQANALFTKHVPEVDKRQTPEERATQNQEWAAATERQQSSMKAEADAFCKKYGASLEMVKIPDGMMAVYLSVNFDDSDIRSDYFNSHHSIGVDMLLAIVPKQPETERLAWSVVKRYQELAGLSWRWESQKWSMGHGNWLQSGIIGTEKRGAYDGRDEVSVWYEVEFNSYAKEMHTAKGYPGNVGAAIAPPAKPAEGVIVRHNEAHNGIEVVFAAKPDDAITEHLKRWGFRWSRYQGLWYRHYNRPLFDEVRAALCPAEAPNNALTLQGTPPESSEVPAASPALVENCDNCHYSECDYKSDPADIVKNSCKAWAPIEAAAVVTRALVVLPC